MATATTTRTPLEHFNQLAATYETSTGGCTRELARHVLGLAPALTAESTVLDNACGTGPVTDEILNHLQAKPVLHVVDVAPNMVDIARERFKEYPNVHCAIMPGEKLDFPDDTFDLSVTNLGIMFFSEPAAGAREIFRTLKPGGTALVTTWKDIGYQPHVQEAHRAAQPEADTYKIPVPEVWFREEHLSGVMKEAGFAHVDISTPTVHYSAESASHVGSALMGMFGHVGKDWGEKEQEVFKSTLTSLAASNAQAVTRTDGSPGFGLPMVGIVAICKK